MIIASLKTSSKFIKKVKRSKAGDNDLKEGFDAIVIARKEYAEEIFLLKLKEMEERGEADGGGVRGEEGDDQG